MATMIDPITGQEIPHWFYLNDRPYPQTTMEGLGYPTDQGPPVNPDQLARILEDLTLSDRSRGGNASARPGRLDPEALNPQSVRHGLGADVMTEVPGGFGAPPEIGTHPALARGLEGIEEPVTPSDVIDMLLAPEPVPDDRMDPEALIPASLRHGLGADVMTEAPGGFGPLPDAGVPPELAPMLEGIEDPAMPPEMVAALMAGEPPAVDYSAIDPITGLPLDDYFTDPESPYPQTTMEDLGYPTAQGPQMPPPERPGGPSVTLPAVNLPETPREWGETVRRVVTNPPGYDLPQTTDELVDFVTPEFGVPDWLPFTEQIGDFGEGLIGIPESDGLPEVTIGDELTVPGAGRTMAPDTSPVPMLRPDVDAEDEADPGIDNTPIVTSPANDPSSGTGDGTGQRSASLGDDADAAREELNGIQRFFRDTFGVDDPEKRASLSAAMIAAGGAMMRSEGDVGQAIGEGIGTGVDQYQGHRSRMKREGLAEEEMEMRRERHEQDMASGASSSITAKLERRRAAMEDKANLSPSAWAELYPEFDYDATPVVRGQPDKDARIRELHHRYLQDIKDGVDPPRGISTQQYHDYLLGNKSDAITALLAGLA